MFGADMLGFHEFAVNEPLPISTVHSAILEFLRGRKDVVLFGAQAVNAFVREKRMTEDVDLLSTRAAGLAAELCYDLQERFHIAVRVRKLDSRAFRVFQSRKGGNRHLADIRQVDNLPKSVRKSGVAVLAPAELVADKVLAYHARRGKPKAGTDWRDIAVLLLAFPDLKCDPGPVSDLLACASALASWREIVAEEIRPHSRYDPY